MKSIYDFSVKTISGEEKSLADYKGKVMPVSYTHLTLPTTPYV